MATHLLTGDDESILRTAVADLVHELVGDGDRSMMVDDFEGEEYELRVVVDAAQTPPFLTDKRVVVAREVGRFTADQLAPLLAYVDRPLDTTDLVLGGGGGRVAKKLTDAVKATGTVINTAPPARANDRRDWIADRVAAGSVRLDRPAMALLAERLGEDVSRLDGILHTLESAFGDGHALGPGEIEPFLGEAGGIPPWDLTDAIDRGGTSAALDMLGRMIHGGHRHPLQIMSILHGHYAAIARLDGVDARSEQDAQAATGLKSGFRAKKSMEQYRRLGGPNAKRAFELLAQADLDLRGGREIPDDIVMEVLVARLSKLRR
ncbi:MAG: DNA polymerase III subunit delta [Acidimicrobiia bacterium]|nr:DNA polymerase III subunit delta [Acidimicrobiia bacterium]